MFTKLVFQYTSEKVQLYSLCFSVCTEADLLPEYQGKHGFINKWDSVWRRKEKKNGGKELDK